MAELNIDFPPNREVIINGERYEVRVSDVEALELASSLAAEFEGISVGEPHRVFQAIKAAISALDALLGDGAASRLTGGRSLSAAFMLGEVVTPVLRAVLEPISEDYAERLSLYD